MIRNSTLLWALLFICVQAYGQNSTFHGVFVGINDYPGLSYDLQFAQADASDMKGAMQSHQNWPGYNLTQLIGSQATKTNIRNAVWAMPRINGDDETTGDTEMFCFSGHGEEENPLGIITVDGYTNIAPSELDGYFRYNHPTYNRYACIIDACHSGVFVSAGVGGVTLTSCGASESSTESGDFEHGVFTHFLLQGLENSRACGTDGIVSAEELHYYAAPLTNDYAPGQNPQIIDGWDGMGYFSENLNFKNSDNQVAAAPQNLEVEANPGNNHVLLTWDANTEEDLSLYEVWRDYHTDGVVWRAIATTASNSYVDDEFYYSHPYGLHGVNYKIRARDNASNYSDFSNVVYRNLEPFWRLHPPDLPTAYGLEQNFPNPFNPSTVIKYSLPSPGEVRLSVFDMLGREVTVLVHAVQQAGFHEVMLDASGLPSGVYVYKLTAGEFKATRRLALVK
jgi:hypothetical protein